MAYIFVIFVEFECKIHLLHGKVSGHKEVFEIANARKEAFMAMQNACKEKQSIPEDENTSLHDIDFTELKSLHTTYHNADNDLKRGHL